jgi:hypothetical protein
MDGGENIGEGQAGGHDRRVEAIMFHQPPIAPDCGGGHLPIEESGHARVEDAFHSRLRLGGFLLLRLLPPESATQLEKGHGMARQGLQHPALGGCDIARLPIDHANRAEGKALRRAHRRAGIEAHPLCGKQGVRVEARILGGIRHDQKVLLDEVQWAEGIVERGGVPAKADLGQEDLPALFDGA